MKYRECPISNIARVMGFKTVEGWSGRYELKF